MGKAMKSNHSAASGGVSGGVATTPPAGAGPGLGRSGLGAAGGQRLPAAPRERKPALAALAVLLILGGALASAYLVMASGQRVSAIVIAEPVAAGQRIPAGALREAQIGDTGIQFLNWSEHAKVTGTYAAVPLVKGTLLTNAMLSRDTAPARGRLVVGLSLKPGQFPAGGLANGRRVGLYAVGGGSGGSGPKAGTVLSGDAIIVNVARGGGDRLRSDATSIDVAVLPADAPALAQAASAQAVAVALVPEGSRVAPGGGTGGAGGGGTGGGDGGAATPPATTQTPAPGGG
ncbi:hypothetical protein [Actinomadura parmotrematis]|uniref:SAF domain-containing protein n=1 Tax=Actinomadura parmotrematis TaxID=2864039 RepID=A0ABS7FWB4_9ACTN|nr:hypothetical protein [Actinomadura parmotrematis]MBW8484709.1 hypothetical protein [Actinomadura parmotrematis]